MYLCYVLTILIGLPKVTTEDDTDARYPNGYILAMAYILQVRALMDGYLLPANVRVTDGDKYISNTAAIGDVLYYVIANSDNTGFYANIQPVPSQSALGQH